MQLAHAEAITTPTNATPIVPSKSKVDSIADDEEEARERRRKWKNGLER